MGRWNPALFTPAGIRSRVFNLSEQTPIEVLVSLDDIGPTKVRYEDIVVWADQNRLAVELEICDFAKLQKAIALVVNVIQALPETPVNAVGINVRYESDPGDERVSVLLSGKPDDLLSDMGYEITGRQSVRTLNMPTGRITFAVEALPDDKWDVLLNFEMRSKSVADLAAWLEATCPEVEKHVRKLLPSVVEFQEEELGCATNNTQ